MVTPNTHAAAVAQMQVRNLIAGLRKCADVVSSPREADALARAVHMLETPIAACGCGGKCSREATDPRAPEQVGDD